MNKFLICILLSLALIETVHSNETFPFKEGYPLKSGSTIGKARISIDNSNVRLGVPFQLKITFTNKGGGDYFYNPYMNRLLPLPYALAIYNSNQEYVGDLVGFTSGSRAGVSPNNWVWVASNSFVGKNLTINLPNHISFRQVDWLPGTYYLQMIYFNPFIASNPARLQGNPQKSVEEYTNEFLKRFERKELFRSNHIKISVIVLE